MKIGSVESVAKGSSGEVHEVTPGWERVRVQIDTGAIDASGPKEVAQALDLREPVLSKHGVHLVAANGQQQELRGEEGGRVHGQRGRCECEDPTRRRQESFVLSAQNEPWKQLRRLGW